MAFWNGENIYVVDLLRTYQNGNAKKQDEHFYDVLKSKKECPFDLIDLTYRELCFNLETFYGYPSSTEFSEKVKTEGLDAALSEQDPETRTLLLSADRAEYATGLHRLCDYLLDDGGHTGFSEYPMNHILRMTSRFHCRRCRNGMIRVKGKEQHQTLQRQKA